MSSPPDTAPVEHWTFQVDGPFRGPAEIRELIGAPPGAPPGAAADSWGEVEEVFGEDLALAEDEYEFQAYDEYEESGEDEAFDDSELTEADLLEEAPAREHPLAAVFSLPRLAFDAMAKGAWSTAIATAVGAGNRDVNQLTNMVFWFKHPQLIGQKLAPGQRDLVREWLQIRDTVVKPALSGGTPPPPSPSGPPTAAPTGIGNRTSIPADGLRWYGPPGEETPELLAFMRKVYDLHVERSKKRPTNTFVDTLPESALSEVEPGKMARKDAAAKAREMLEAAQAALVAQGLAGIVRIGVLSAYRSADQQFDIWQGKTKKGKGGFPHYYAQTKPTRQSPKYGGEHSDKAAAHLAEYMAKYVAAPGYSNHQDGLALDLGTRKGKGRLIKLYKGAWFHSWLTANARKYGFHPLPSEAWHWTFRPQPGGPSFEAESWSSEVTPTTIQAGRMEVPRIPLLAGHRGNAPDLVLRWNDMPTVPKEIDVVVHLHGYSFANMTLPKHMEVWAGLDLGPVDGAAGTGRSRPTLTVLPRGHFTGVKVGRIYRYTFPALTTRDGLTSLVEAALKHFAGRVGGLPPRVGRLILTAHSGGGAPLMQILRRHDPQEVHVFDGLYQDPGPLAEWAIRHIRADRSAVASGGTPTGAMRVFSGPSTRRFSGRLDATLARELRDAPAPVRDRYRVESSTLGHWQIARQYGWRTLSDPAMDVPDATRLSQQKARVPQLFELDTAAAPFAPEVALSAEGPFVPEALAIAEADEDEAAWEPGELETEGDAEVDELEYDELIEKPQVVDEATGALGAGLATDELELLAPEGLEELDAAKDLDAGEELGYLEDLEDLDEGEDLYVGEGFDLGEELAEHELEPLVEAITDVAEDVDALEEEHFFPSDFLKAVFRKPTVGFEFDVHYGPIPAQPALNGTTVSSHTHATEGFKVKLDGPRLEINTRPFESTDTGRQELTKTAGLIATFAEELEAGCRKATPMTVAGVSGSARPFLHPTMGIPIGKLPVGGRFTNCRVWASPQATLTVRLEGVARLVERIKASEGAGPGRALTGGPTARMGLRSEALYRAYREVKRARRTIPLSDALEGFLILLASYLWTSELPYRFPAAGERVNGARHDYEPFGKAYLPINVKTPLSQVFSTLLTTADQDAFRKQFADGAARVNLFRLARPGGATLADGDRKFLPGGRVVGGEPSVHAQQRAVFHVVPTWSDVVEHTLDPTHRGWGTRLLVPLSNHVDVSKTRPRVLVELRRIGFASVDRSRWTDYMLAMHRLTADLNR